MAAATTPLSVDDMLMGEILMSLKRDSPKLEPQYRSKRRGLSVQVALPLPAAPSGASSPADVFSFDAFSAVSPVAFKLPLHPLAATATAAAASPSTPPTTTTPRGGNKRYGPVVQLEDLRECFNMPIAAVARKFGICATLLKKICRRHGIQRWPHRQIRSLQKSIDMLRESLSVAKGSNKEYIAKKIAAFEYTLECIMQDPNTAAKGISAGRLASPASEEMVKRGNRARGRKRAAAKTPLSDDEEAASGAAAAAAAAASPVVAPAVPQDWTADGGQPGPDAQPVSKFGAASCTFGAASFTRRGNGSHPTCRVTTWLNHNMASSTSTWSIQNPTGIFIKLLAVALMSEAQRETLNRK
ncbi:NLP7 protein [Phytophthora cinnamomi]|uniref:NLP7 protein n=1 Tax=Phytophthora cinnamomi TaxID=4785 RepID=UPI00355A7345|nr:NLP7 protein [Phytophthora cinnamomi]